ncbi:hypothetical protein Cagg_1848 [Chloroflexus aggregans DSM 9485]|uniref:Uncharacterized protein n=1 Tax=Chloroflexus aggregans (strain MD-66 / DSM 9485) TaxID=326427 RepID=B8GBB5_CHLAD|nr:hypothetical protein Cagg_1848 [Chloroflexus aggregans DSM 9485]
MPMAAIARVSGLGGARLPHGRGEVGEFGTPHGGKGIPIR